MSNSLIKQVECKKGCATVTNTGVPLLGTTDEVKVDNIFRGCYEADYEADYEDIYKEKNGCVIVDVSLILSFKNEKYTNFEIH